MNHEWHRSTIACCALAIACRSSSASVASYARSHSSSGEAGGSRTPASALPAVLLLVVVPREADAVAAPLDCADEVEPLAPIDEAVEVEALPRRVVEGDVLASALEDTEGWVSVLSQRRAAEVLDLPV